MRKDSLGFTFVELVIAMAVFVVAATMIAGVFARVVRTERQANHLMIVNSEGGLIIERIAREIRLGYNFELSGGVGECGSSGISYNTVEFTRPKTEGGTVLVSYRWNKTAGAVERSENGGTYTALNASQTKIERLCFIETQSGNNPWRITTLLSIGSQDEQLDYTTHFQTTVSSRILPKDIE